MAIASFPTAVSAALLPTIGGVGGAALTTTRRILIPSRTTRLAHKTTARQHTFNSMLRLCASIWNGEESSSSSSASSPRRVVDTVHDDPRLVLRHKHKQLLRASRLSLAPMMEYTDRHFRHLIRLISQETLLYTEMVSANAIAHERFHVQEESAPVLFPSLQPTTTTNDKDYYYLHRYLGQSKGAVTDDSPATSNTFEGPSVLQLGGSDPDLLRKASQTVLEVTSAATSAKSSSSSFSPSFCDYTAINLNCGCPSQKVAGKGCFGAALMHEPQLVQDLTSALSEGCQGRFPITVKCRIGTDAHAPFDKKNYNNNNNHHDEEEEEYARLCHFIETVAADGIVTDFAIHARIAVLKKSFSPADNRKIPPLKYHYVQRLISDFPHLTFSLNGGIETLEQVQEQLQGMPGLQGVMVGRAWAADPWGFSMADSLLYHNDDNDDSSRPKATTNKNRLQILQAYGRYADAQEVEEQRMAIESGHYPQGIRRFLVKAVSHLFAGEVNAKRFRIALDDIANQQATFNKKKRQSGAQQHSEQLLTSTTTSVIPPGPSFSELLVNVAMEHLSEEILLEAPLESNERRVEEEQRRQERRHHASSSTSSTIISSSSESSSSSSTLLASTDSEGQSYDTMSRVEEWQQARRSENNKAADSS